MIVALGAIGVVCITATVVCATIGMRSYVDVLGSQGTTTSDDVDSLFRVLYVLSQITTVTAAGALLAIVAILALLARWWQLRPAPAR
jgi:hypothetical protein